MKDGKFLHFLKELPSWVVLSLLFFFVMLYYQYQRDPFMQRVLDTILGGLLGVLVGRRLSPSTFNAENISTESMTMTAPIDVRSEAPFDPSNPENTDEPR